MPGERLDEVNEHLRLIQKTGGLTFGTDAYLLAAYVRPEPHSVAVELGSGSGIVSLLLSAQRKIRRITAVEIQPAYHALCARNIALNGMEETVFPLCADVRTLTPATVGCEVNLVISNPPYMTCGSGKRNTDDAKFIARHEVCGTVYDFCAAASRVLRHRGKFVTVWRPDRLTDLFAALREARLEPKRVTFVHSDASSEPCMVLTEAVKGASPSLRITPPLFLYLPTEPGTISRTLTPQAAQIYGECGDEKNTTGAKS